MKTSHPPVMEPEVSSASSVSDTSPAVVCAVLMPHAPILVPEVGGVRGEVALASRRAMRDAALRVLRHRPQTLVLLSPHSPQKSGGFGLWSDDPLRGDLRAFHAPQANVSLSNDKDFSAALVRAAHAGGLGTWCIRHRDLDHGAVVPLWFLQEAGWRGPTVVVGLNPTHEGGLTELGRAIAGAAQQQQRRVALVASGDMSHRLKPDAPCGFHPSARLFDEMFIELLRAGSYQELEKLDPDLRTLAAEDAVDSTLVAAAAVDWNAAGHAVLNYEGPFGVGYGVAVLFETEPGEAVTDVPSGRMIVPDGESLPAVARAAVLAVLRNNADAPPSARGEYLSQHRGVFVTIRNAQGGLRGCVGTFVPVTSNLVTETWRSAQLAALKDTRFSPVALREMAGLRFEVSVLHALEEIPSVAGLDPQRYGVLVSTSDGRRGLLLPNIAGINTAAQQLSLACEKGWIDVREPKTLCRFKVDHFEEAELPSP